VIQSIEHWPVGIADQDGPLGPSPGRHYGRVVCWFSCGAASAVAAKLALAHLGAEDIAIVRIHVANEHSDNARFAADCERWFGRPIVIMQSSRYASAWEVWEKRRFLVGPQGAPCTTEMKKAVRWEFEKDWNPDAQVFGYTAEERDRAARFRKQNPDVRLVTPLIDAGLTKADCLAMVERAGITLPTMYALGYQNNNCIGCVKGGPGYWNKIRRDFPDVFARMAALERDIGHAVCKDTTGDRAPVFLDELPVGMGRHDETVPDCSLLCAMAEQDIAAVEAAQ